MRKLNYLLLFSFFFVLGISPTMAQYITPGTGVVWNLDSLVAHSNGVVVANGGGSYQVHADLTIETGDHFNVLTNAMVRFDPAVLFTVKGSFTINPPQGVMLTATDTLNNYKGITFEDNSVIVIRKSRIEFGGGIRKMGGSLSIDSCIIRKQSKLNSTSAALELFGGNTTITRCQFTDNIRSAIASGANVSAAPVIKHCYFYNNTTDNSNRPQINLGPSGDGNTTVIISNAIIGNRANTKVGGIAVSSLLGVTCNAVIDSNMVKDNRYGIAFTGNNMNGEISYNNVQDNNSEGNPMLGGSGLNFYGVQNYHAMVTGNTITGNLWGITAQSHAMINLGDTAAATYNPGNNTFENNGNGGNIIAFYNNTPNAVSAMNNCWGVNNITPAAIEQVIVHKVDIDSLGLVTFVPFNMCGAGGHTVSGTIHYSNNANTPLSGLTIDLKDNSGNVVATATTNTTGAYSFGNVNDGSYTLSVSTAKPWGGVSASDVLLYKKHIANISQLSGIYLASGDVNGSGSLSASDVLLIKKRIAIIITSFSVGDWLFNNVPLTVNGNDVIQDFNGLVYGDANGSYTPPAR